MTASEKQPLALSKPKKRLDWIDGMKGLAILGVVWFHFFQNYTDRIAIVSILDRIGAKIGFAAVDLFFLLAGFNVVYVLVSKSLQQQGVPTVPNWKAWLWKRINRLYPTYFLAVAFTLVLYGVVDRFPENVLSINFILSCLGLAGLTFQIINPGLWFFTVLLEAYLLIPVVLKLCRRPYWILVGGLFVGTLVKAICLAFEPGSAEYHYFLSHNFIGSYFFQMCLGMYWGLVYFREKGFPKKHYLISAVFFVAGAIAFVLLPKWVGDVPYKIGFDMAITPFLFLGLYWSLERLYSILGASKAILSPVSTSGIYSYHLYLIHQPFYFVFLPLFVGIIPLNAELKLSAIVILTAVTLVAYTYLFAISEAFIRKSFVELRQRSS